MLALFTFAMTFILLALIVYLLTCVTILQETVRSQGRVNAYLLKRIENAQI